MYYPMALSYPQIPSQNVFCFVLFFFQLSSIKTLNYIEYVMTDI